ncbi:MAG: glycosyltransferase family 4 protein [Cyanobacteria bacterium K_Offshore_surface_m2_239]|nr:glycosyltransferase family 4 protein [Cyanobacteria bacterium K_Offshore_surface_m2_239]
MRRLLVVLRQPPGCSGVQALIYNKLLPFFEDHGWEIHFAGPSPWLTSVLTERLDYPPERLHYSTEVSASLSFSVRKNRHRKGTLPHLGHGLLQLLARWLERLRHHDSEAHLLRGLSRTVHLANQRWHFDLVAGKTPDFQVLALTHRLCQELDKPLLALIDDPYGARDEQGFHPKEPERQRSILDRARGALFMSPLTRDRYVEAGLLSPEKAHVISDSYPVNPELYRQTAPTPTAHPSWTRRRGVRGDQRGGLRLIYLGMLPEWRPIEPFLEALRAANQPQDPQPAALELTIHGFVYPAARRRIADDPRLASLIQIQPLVSYATSHALAAAADVQLVVIGPRHLDNVPSKFFEYLGHHKPLLVLGPPQNPLRELVDRLKIGLYVDGRSAEAIYAALDTLRRDHDGFVQAYSTRATAIEAFSAPTVARRFCQLLDQALA